jgi:hemerythrin
VTVPRRLPRSNIHGAARAAEKILESQQPFLADQAQPCWNGSLSIGIAEVDATMLNTEDLLKRADRALYEAKQKGGGRAVAA